MIRSDRAAANIGRDIGIKVVNRDKINNDILGEVIGTHVRIEFVTLKRLIDMITRQIIPISDKHNWLCKLLLKINSSNRLQPHSQFEKTNGPLCKIARSESDFNYR